MRGICLRQLPKKGSISAGDATDIQLSSPCGDTVLITGKVSPNVVLDSSDFPELVTMSLELKKEELWISHQDTQIVRVSTHIFIMCSAILGPYLGVKVVMETHTSKSVGKFAMGKWIAGGKDGIKGAKKPKPGVIGRISADGLNNSLVG